MMCPAVMQQQQQHHTSSILTTISEFPRLLPNVCCNRLANYPFEAARVGTIIKIVNILSRVAIERATPLRVVYIATYCADVLLFVFRFMMII